jgi:multiple sugar transport system substrate-binding protein
MRLSNPAFGKVPRVLSSLAGAALVTAMIACGGGEPGTGPARLSYYVFPEPSGAFAQAAKRCSRDSHGAYRLRIQVLPSDADSQRQNLVRRLSAKDDAIDLVGMDVIWTAEFAEAGWIREWTGERKAQVLRGTLDGPVKTATYKRRLYGAPANSNTQLLWYRKDLVPTPPRSWTEMIDMATKLRKAGRIEIQGRQYEGLTVWFNSLLNSAGGQVLRGTSKVALGEPARRAAAIMRRLAGSSAADPSLSQQQEDQNRLAFEKGNAAFELNYPFVYPSAKQNAPRIYRNMGYAPWPSVDAGRPARVTIGGLNIGVSAYSKHPREAFAAAACMRDRSAQEAAAVKGGLPPTLDALYDDPQVRKAYPFADLIRRQLQDPGVRPQSPAYSDISLAIQKALSPPRSIDPDAVADKLRKQVEKALTSGALL